MMMLLMMSRDDPLSSTALGNVNHDDNNNMPHQQRRQQRQQQRRGRLFASSLLSVGYMMWVVVGAYCCNNSWTSAAESKNNQNSQQQQQQQHRYPRGRRRRVAMGDFARVNSLLEHQVVEFYWNDSSSSPLVMEQSGMTVQLQRLVCTGINVGDVDMEWSRRRRGDDGGGGAASDASSAADNGNNLWYSTIDLSTTLLGSVPAPPPINLTEFEDDVNVHFVMTLLDLSFTCIGDFDFEFFWGTTTGQGQVYIETTRTGNQMLLGQVLAIDDNGNDNSDETSIRSSTTFVNTPPIILEISTCQATIDVDKMHFELLTTTSQELGLGLLAEDMLNAMDLREMYAQVIADYLCDFVPDKDQDENDDSDEPGMLEDFAALIATYLSNTTTTTTTTNKTTDDLRAMEAALKLPADFQAVNFMHPQTPISHLLRQLLLTGGLAANHDDNGENASPPLLSSNLLGGLLFFNDHDEHAGAAMKLDLDSILLGNDTAGGDGLRRHLQGFPNVSMSSHWQNGAHQQQFFLPTLLNDVPFLPTTASPTTATTPTTQAPAERLPLGAMLHSPVTKTTNQASLHRTLPEASKRNTMEMPTPFGSLGIHFRELAIMDSPEYSILSVNIVGKHSLETKLRVANVKIRLAVEITSDNLHNMTFEPQTLHVEVPLDPFTVSVAILLVLDENKVAMLILDGLSDKRHSLFDCFQSAIYKSEVVTLKMSNPVGLGQPHSHGLEDFSPGVARIAAEFVNIFYAGFGPSISRAIPNVFQTKMVETMNQRQQVAKTMTVAADMCKGGDGLINSGDLARVGGRILRRLLEFMLPSFGAFIDDVSIVKQGTLIAFDRSIVLGETDARLQFILDNFRIDNIDSIGDLSVFVPVTNHSSILNNSVTLGVPPRPLRISVSMVFGLTLNGKESYNDGEIKLSLLGSQLIAQILVHISEAGLASLSIQDMLDLDLNCILPRLLGVPKLNVYGVRLDDRPFLSFENVDFVSHGATNTLLFDCVECQSRSFREIDNLLQQSEEHQAAIVRVAEAINWMFSTFVEGDSSYVQTLLDRMLVDVSKQCEDTIIKQVEVQYQPFDHVNHDNDTDSIQYILAMLIVLGAVLFVYFGICIYVRCVAARRQRKLLQTLSGTQLLAICQAQQKRDEAQEARSALSKPMFQSNEVPIFARWFVPLLLTGNLALFLLGHWSIGGSAHVYIQLVGEELVLDDFYDISIAQIAMNLWNTGARATSTVMILFSLTWPYVELLSILVLWFMPPHFLSMQRRGVILTWLHRLGKWCMANVFVLLVVMAAFQISTSNPQESFLPGDFYKVDLFIAPSRGLYEQLVAQVLLQVSLHFIFMYQRKIEAAVNEEYKEATMHVDFENEKSGLSEADTDDIDETELDTPERAKPREVNALHQCVFDRPPRGDETDGLIVRCVGVNVVVALLATFLLMLLVCAGCALPSFTTNVQGIVGVLIGFGRGDGTSTYYHSIFSIAKLLLDMTDFLSTTKDKVGLFCVMTFFIVTTFMAPIALVVCHLFWWFHHRFGSTTSTQVLGIWIEILESWQYLEMYIVIVLVVVWQLRDISELVLNDSYCNDNDDIKSFFASMSHYNLLSSEDDAQCFRLQPSIESGLYIILGVCVLLTILRMFTSLAVATTRSTLVY